MFSRLVTPWIHERSCTEGLGLGRRGTTSGTCSRAKYGGAFLCLVIEFCSHVSTRFRNFAAVQRVFLAATCAMSDGLLIYVSLKMLGTKAQENMAGVEKETFGNIWKHGSFLWPLKLDLRSGRNAISALYAIPTYLPMQRCLAWRPKP